MVVSRLKEEIKNSGSLVQKGLVVLFVLVLLLLLLPYLDVTGYVVAPADCKEESLTVGTGDHSVKNLFSGKFQFKFVGIPKKAIISSKIKINGNEFVISYQGKVANSGLDVEYTNAANGKLTYKFTYCIQTTVPVAAPVTNPVGSGALFAGIGSAFSSGLSRDERARLAADQAAIQQQGTQPVPQSTCQEQGLSFGLNEKSLRTLFGKYNINLVKVPKGAKSAKLKVNGKDIDVLLNSKADVDGLEINYVSSANKQLNFQVKYCPESQATKQIDKCEVQSATLKVKEEKDFEFEDGSFNILVVAIGKNHKATLFLDGDEEDPIKINGIGNVKESESLIITNKGTKGKTIDLEVKYCSDGYDEEFEEDEFLEEESDEEFFDEESWDENDFEEFVDDYVEEEIEEKKPKKRGIISRIFDDEEEDEEDEYLEEEYDDEYEEEEEVSVRRPIRRVQVPVDRGLSEEIDSIDFDEDFDYSEDAEFDDDEFGAFEDEDLGYDETDLGGETLPDYADAAAQDLDALESELEEDSGSELEEELDEEEIEEDVEDLEDEDGVCFDPDYKEGKGKYGNLFTATEIDDKEDVCVEDTFVGKILSLFGKVDDTVVKEWYCEDDEVKSANVRCPEGFSCKRGACV